MDIKRKIVKVILLPFNHVLYWLSGFFPRNKYLWVFGSSGGNRFADNSKWLFLYINSGSSTKVKTVWLSQDREIVEYIRKLGMKAYTKHSVMGVWTALRAGIYIFDSYSTDINFWLSRNVKKFNLWHGSPLKRIERDITQPDNSYFRAHHGGIIDQLLFRFYNPFMFERYEAMICTSNYTRKIFASAFNIPEDRIWVTGYPRNDSMVGSIYTKKFSDQEYWFRVLREKKKENGKVITYLPTFRDTRLNLVQIYHDVITWLASELPEYTIIFKPHKNELFTKISAKENLIVLPSEVDVYPMLAITDILITDYSSVFFDFLITDKPVVFFPFDYEEYILKDRELYVSYEQDTPGPKARSLLELQEILENINQTDGHTNREDYVRVKRKYNSFTDGFSSERVYQSLLEDINSDSNR